MKSRPPLLDPHELYSIRAAAAVALAVALRQMFPRVIIISTRATDIGFVCECLFSEPVDASVLGLVERQMTSLMQQDLELVSSEMLLSNIQEYLRYHGQAERADLLEDTGDLIEIVRFGDYLEPCPGPHAPRLSDIRAFKLMSLDTADQELADGHTYSVTTFAGTAFGSRQDLKQFLKLSDKAAEVDHRRVGRELGLYEPQADIGSYLWSGKGNIIREILIHWLQQEQRQQQFEIVHTPTLVRADWLHEIGVLTEADEWGVSVIPPSRRPLHALLFGAHLHSYRDLPVRYAECAAVHQPIRRCRLWGVFSQPNFTADESSTFCREDQALAVLTSSLQFINKTITLCGFSSRIYLLGRGASYAGTLSSWDSALGWLKEACEITGIGQLEQGQHTSFEGPRVDVRIIDALGREWPGPSVGFDFALPERLGLRYQGKNDVMKAPILVTQSTFSSLERFIGLLIEQFGGSLPLWLAPEQIRILPVNDEDRPFAAEVQQRCTAVGLRASIDCRTERLGAKVFAAETAKVPHIAIVGAQERKEGVVTVRGQGRHQRGGRVPVNELIAAVSSEVEQRRLPPE